MKNICLGGIIVFLSLFVSCSSTDSEIINEIVSNHVITGENLVDCKSFRGKAEQKDLVKNTGIYSVKNQLEYAKFWNLQEVIRKSADVIDFEERLCILAILKPSDYTQIKFHKIIKGIDGDYHVYFIVDRKPLETEKKLFPFCVVNAPAIKGNLKIELIYLKNDPHLGYSVQPAKLVGSMKIK